MEDAVLNDGFPVYGIVLLVLLGVIIISPFLLSCCFAVFMSCILKKVPESGTPIDINIELGKSKKNASDKNASDTDNKNDPSNQSEACSTAESVHKCCPHGRPILSQTSITSHY